MPRLAVTSERDGAYTRATTLVTWNTSTAICAATRLTLSLEVTARNMSAEPTAASRCTCTSTALPATTRAPCSRDGALHPRGVVVDHRDRVAARHRPRAPAPSPLVRIPTTITFIVVAPRHLGVHVDDDLDVRLSQELLGRLADRLAGGQVLGVDAEDHHVAVQLLRHVQDAARHVAIAPRDGLRLQAVMLDDLLGAQQHFLGLLLLGRAAASRAAAPAAPR